MLGETSQCTHTCKSCFHEKIFFCQVRFWRSPEWYICWLWRPGNLKVRFLAHVKKVFNKNWGTGKASLERLPSTIIHAYRILTRSYSRTKSACWRPPERYNRGFTCLKSKNIDFSNMRKKFLIKIGGCVKQVRRHLPVHLHGYKSFSREYIFLPRLNFMWL